MRISDDCAVSLHFVLKDVTGQVLHASSEETPLSYLHGHGQMVPGLERALRGRHAGETLRVRLEPAEAYGQYDEGKREILPRVDFSDEELEVGNRVYIMGTGGPRQAVILGFDAHSVTCDVNHELAGKTLEFDVHILSVRRATIYELGCGHVHEPETGPG